MQEASVKVEGGKMVNIELKVNEGKVKDVKIRGDFFLEPPEKLGELEDKIRGIEINSTAEEVSNKLKDIEAELIGFSAMDVGQAFRKAVEEKGGEQS